MPKPYASSPTNVLIKISGALTLWFKTHQPALKDEFEASDNYGEQAEQVSLALDRAENDVRREFKEGKDVTAHRDTTVEAVQVFAVSLRASARRRMKGKANAKHVLSNFRFPKVSSAYSTNDARELLRKINSALSVHGDLISQPNNRLPAWKAHSTQLNNTLTQIDLDIVREAQESANAIAHRDALKVKAADLIDELDLAAQAALDISKAPLHDLRVIFKTHNPHGPILSDDDDDDDDDTDDKNTKGTEDTETDAKPDASTEPKP